MSRTLVLVALPLLIACASASWRGATLYEELDGQAGIERIVAEFLDRLAGDERVSALFDDTDPERFERLVGEQLCSLADGPCEYTGEDMREVHAGMGITEAQFNAVVEDLQEAMDAAGVPFGAQNRLLARLAPLQREIVERRPLRAATSAPR